MTRQILVDGKRFRRSDGGGVGNNTRYLVSPECLERFELQSTLIEVFNRLGSLDHEDLSELDLEVLRNVFQLSSRAIQALGYEDTLTPRCQRLLKDAGADNS